MSMEVIVLSAATAYLVLYSVESFLFWRDMRKLEARFRKLEEKVGL